MSGFVFEDTGIAASLFLGLYVVLFTLAVYIVYREGFKTVYTLIALFGLIRIGGQVSGVGFAIDGDSNYRWLIAYLVLGAEGYFTLVMAGLYFLAREQKAIFGRSRLAEKNCGFEIGKRSFMKRSFKSWTHIILIAANGVLVAGSAILGGRSDEELAENPGIVETAKVLRTVGQAVFLGLSLCISGITVYNLFHKGLRTRVMFILVLVIPFITIRGIFGVLCIYVIKMDYMRVENYFSHSNHRDMTIFEYILGVSMEFITGFAMVNCYWVRSKPVNFDDESVRLTVLKS